MTICIKNIKRELQHYYDKLLLSHTAKLRLFVEYKHDKVLQSRIFFLTLKRHHQARILGF